MNKLNIKIDYILQNYCPKEFINTLKYHYLVEALVKEFNKQ